MSWEKSKVLRSAPKVLALTLILVITISLLLPNTEDGSPVAANSRLLPIYRVDTERTVSLTFDAAWGADKTLDILNILDDYKIKVTFFLVSFWMDAYPDLVCEISRRGHEIGTHSATHPDMTKISTEEIYKELQQSCAIITQLTGQTVQVFRAPFGAYNNNLISIAKELSLTTIQWDVDSLDWKGLSAQEIAERTQKAKGGSIILCHNNSDNIVEALPLIIEGLKVKGLQIVPVSMQLYTSDYYIDSQGTQKRKSSI